MNILMIIFYGIKRFIGSMIFFSKLNRIAIMQYEIIMKVKFYDTMNVYKTIKFHMCSKRDSVIFRNFKMWCVYNNYNPAVYYIKTIVDLKTHKVIYKLDKNDKRIV